MKIDDLATEFRARLIGGMRESRVLGYDPTRFEQMLDEQDAVSLAKKLVSSGTIQSGPKEMAKLGRKDLTMESIMIEPKFQPLFSQSEIEAATWRLQQI